jgi:uncharacterized membrane protein YvbJ
LLYGKNIVIEKLFSLLSFLKELYFFKLIRRRWKLTILILLAFFLFFGYFLGRINTSREYILSKLEMSLKNSDTSTLSDIVKVDGERVKEKKLESLVEYYSNGNNKIDTLITNLKNNNETKDFKLQSKKYFFWNMYYLDVKTFNIKIKSNFEEGNFILGNSGKVKAGETIKNVIPGNYKITGSLNSNYEEIKTSKEIVVMEDKEIELNFPATKITINSDFQDAEVYINGKDIKKEVKDLKDFGPVPTDGTVSVYLEKDFPWGRNKGEEVKITENPTINLTVPISNETLEGDLTNIITKFYESVFVALNKQNKKYIENCTNDIKNKIYSSVEKKYILFKNKYSNLKINIDFDNSQYFYTDDTYRATIVANVQYDVSKAILDINKETYTKSFFTRIVYKDDKWIVEDVDNFNLE